MPNSRKAGKKQVGVWLTEAERKELLAIAKENGCSGISELLKLLIRVGGKLGILILALWLAFRWTHF